jgi:hypothetical protein
MTLSRLTYEYRTGAQQKRRKQKHVARPFPKRNPKSRKKKAS